MGQLAKIEKAENEFGELMKVGAMIAKSGYFADAKEESQAVVKVLAGRELGIGPVTAMQGIYIVKGRVTLGANLMASLIKSSGKYNYRVVELTDKACRILFYEDGKQVGESAFTMDDAKKAQLGGANWTGYARNMLFARALSNGAKWYCPDAFSGTTPYTREEIEQTGGVEELPEVDTATGEIIDAEVVSSDAEADPAEEPKPTRRLDKRQGLVDYIVKDWDLRAEHAPEFMSGKRRKNSIIGQMQQAFPVMETADMSDADAVRYWLDNATYEQLESYGRHNRKQRKIVQEAAELAQEGEEAAA